MIKKCVNACFVVQHCTFFITHITFTNKGNIWVCIIASLFCEESLYLNKFIKQLKKINRKSMLPLFYK